jgi:hypothetical protein
VTVRLPALAGADFGRSRLGLDALRLSGGRRISMRFDNLFQGGFLGLPAGGSMLATKEKHS